MNQTELEKTELEIAKLKLAQEKHKLEQMQKRQKVVDGLGQGAAAVGGAAKSGVQWVLGATALVLLGAILGPIMVAVYILTRFDIQCVAFPDAGFLERVGCTLGEHHSLLIWSPVIGVALVVLLVIFNR